MKSRNLMKAFKNAVENREHIIVLNGYPTGILNHLKLLKKSNVFTNIDDETLTQMKKYSKTQSYYFYDSTKLKNSRIYDVECPKLDLYDDFIDSKT